MNSYSFLPRVSVIVCLHVWRVPYITHVPSQGISHWSYVLCLLRSWKSNTFRMLYRSASSWSQVDSGVAGLYSPSRVECRCHLSDVFSLVLVVLGQTPYRHLLTSERSLSRYNSNYMKNSSHICNASIEWESPVVHQLATNSFSSSERSCSNWLKIGCDWAYSARIIFSIAWLRGFMSHAYGIGPVASP